MGKVILEHRDGRLESLKCKSETRAREIASKRPSVKDWNFYGKNEIIPRPSRKKKEQPTPLSFEELEAMMRSRGMF